MTRTILAFAAILLLALTGCASVQAQPAPDSKPVTLQQIASDDLDAAIAAAKDDPVALQCWNVLKANLGTLNKPLPEVRGIASGIQAKRTIKARLDAGLPPEVVSGCATLYVQEHFGVMKDLMLFLGLAK
jgi:uncharacterized protein YceK